MEMSEEELVEKLEKFLKRYGKPRRITIHPNKQSKVYPYIVNSEDQQFAVFAFDWVKSIGTNTIIRSEQLSDNLKCDGTIIIGKIFSQNAIDMVEDINRRGKRRIILMNFAEIEEILNAS